MRSLGRRLPALGRHLLALAIPPRCPGCGTTVDADHRFCAACWGALRFLGPPWCAGCNLSFEFARDAGALCPKCTSRRPIHAGVRAAVAYGPVARTLALRLKYGGRTGFAVTMARQMARLMPLAVDLIVPVPLHRWRLWSRGFNQAVLIADAISRVTQVPVARAALKRTRATPLLRALGAKRRAAVVRDAFVVADPTAVRGRALVLIDDVYTSGATTDACTRVLLAAGARSVTILCWARVIPREAEGWQAIDFA